jgi:ribulose-5-phosphate 4-epimerase/fuculose-1-phosphate aldolase
LLAVEPNTFWVNPFGVAWDDIKQSDLIRVAEGGKIVEGGPVKLLNVAAYMIHHAVHKARPDANAVAHSHSIYGRAFCTLGRTLDIITQDSCAFYNDIALYDSFKGVVLAEDEGIAIAEALGKKKAALLQSHGLLTTGKIARSRLWSRLIATTGKTIEEAVFWFTSLDKCCHVQLMADAAAGGRGHETVKITDEDAAFTYKTVGRGPILQASVDRWRRSDLRSLGGSPPSRRSTT